MSTLRIEGLRAGVEGREILRGIDLEVRSGEVHVVMGPNGSGKSTLAHVLMGRPGYDVLGGSVTLDGVDLLDAADLAAGPRRAVPRHAVPHRGAGRLARGRDVGGAAHGWAATQVRRASCSAPRRPASASTASS